MSHWQRLDRKLLYTSDWLSVTLDRLKLPDGREIENFELIHFPHDAVGIVGVNQTGDILLVRAYRYIRETFQWEIPGGVIEHDENSMDACRRELLEETGYTAGMFSPLGIFYPHKATCDQKFHLYLAEDLKKTDTKVSEVEITEVAFHPFGNVKQMMDSGEIDDGMSIVGLLKYMQMKK
jgi:ADP-ribose pyrophosphatase